MKVIDYKLKEYGRRICLQQKVCFLAVIIGGCFSHGFVFTNKISYHDDIILNGFGLTFQGGRWFLGIIEACLNLIGGVFSIPWFNGILSLIFIAIAAMLIIDLLDIRSCIGAVLIGIFLAVFPVTTTAYSYMFNAWTDFFCFLLNVIAVRLLVRKRNTIHFISGILAMTLALGVYQAMFSVSASLLLLTLMLELIEGKRNYQESLKQGLYYLVALGIGMCSYLVINKLFIIFGHLELASYKGLDEMGTLEISKLPSKIKMAYTTFFEGNYANIHRSVYFAGIIKIIILISLLMFMVFFIGRIHSVLDRAVFLVYLAVYPLAMNIVYLFSTREDFSVHTLMLYSMVFVLITPIVLAEKLEHLMFGEGSTNKIFVAAEGCLTVLLSLVACVYIYFNLYYSRHSRESG